MAVKKTAIEVVRAGIAAVECVVRFEAEEIIRAGPAGDRVGVVVAGELVRT